MKKKRYGDYVKQSNDIAVNKKIETEEEDEYKKINDIRHF